MRGRPCSICGSDEINQDDSALSAGNTILNVAATFSVPKSTVHRHKVSCLAPKIKAAAKAMVSTKEAKAPVMRAREIAAGAVPTPQEVLTLTGLLDKLVRSLDRLEGSAQVAAADGLHASLAALSGQLHRGIEAAGKLQGFCSDTPQAQQGEKFSVQIILSPPDTKQTGNSPVTIDCTREEHEAPVPQVTARRSPAYHFDTDQDEE